MLGQLNIQGLDKVEVAIKRFQTFEPPDRYFLAFSGGKDSCVIKALADMLEEYELIINSLIKDCIGLDFICDKLGVSEWCEEHCNGNTPDIECVRKYYKEKINGHRKEN